MANNVCITVGSEFVGECSTDPAAQSRAVARGFSQIGTLLRKGAQAMERNAYRDRPVAVPCPHCTFVKRGVKAEEAVTEALWMAVHCPRLAHPPMALNNMVKGYRALCREQRAQIVDLREQVTRLQDEIAAAVSGG